ncbi:MAG: DNA gyrase C-terminal beta-propeller domain-containing protein, partial [Asticcacaulis sp.]
RVDATAAERAAYLKHTASLRAAVSGEGEDAPITADDDGEEGTEEAALTVERIAELGAAEEFILTIADTGFGKRTSSYDYRRTGRGGQGIVAIDLSKRGGRLVASFPVEDTDQLLLVTDGGQLIRTPVSQIRVAGRNTQGVTIFRTSGEKVVSVERLAESGEDEGGEDGPDGAEVASGGDAG